MAMSVQRCGRFTSLKRLFAIVLVWLATGLQMALADDSLYRLAGRNTRLPNAMTVAAELYWGAAKNAWRQRDLYLTDHLSRRALVALGGRSIRVYRSANAQTSPYASELDAMAAALETAIDCVGPNKPNKMLAFQLRLELATWRLERGEPPIGFEKVRATFAADSARWPKCEAFETRRVRSPSWSVPHTDHSGGSYVHRCEMRGAERVVYFEIDSAQLSKDAEFAMKQLVEDIDAGRMIAIEGHSDDPGSDLRNSNLAQERATVVAQRLVEMSVASVSVYSFSDTCPQRATKSGLFVPDNRRVVIRVM